MTVESKTVEPLLDGGIIKDKSHFSVRAFVFLHMVECDEEVGGETREKKQAQRNVYGKIAANVDL